MPGEDYSSTGKTSILRLEIKLPDCKVQLKPLTISHETLSATAWTDEGALWPILRRLVRVGRFRRAASVHHRQATLHLGADSCLSSGAPQRRTGSGRRGHLPGAGASTQPILSRSAALDSG